MTLMIQGQLIAKIMIQRKNATFTLKVILKYPIIFNRYFDSVFNFHQCIVSNERIVLTCFRK